MWSSSLPLIVGAVALALMTLIWLLVLAVDYLPNSTNVQIKTGWLCLHVGRIQSATREQLIQAWGNQSQFRYILRTAIKQGLIRKEAERYHLTETGRQRFERLDAAAKRD